MNLENRDLQLRVPAPATSQESPSQTSVLSEVQILLVEDEPDLADLLSFILKDAGAEVIEVTYAIDALEILEHTQPDMIICNIKLPDADGRLLITKVRTREAEQESGQIPAIAVTSYGREVNIASALSAGFQQIIYKPIDPTEFVSEIANLVGRKKNLHG